MQNCCSEECKEIINLPEDEQRKIRKGMNKSNMIFKKGRSNALLYKK
jgi:UPF0176 protein